MINLNERLELIESALSMLAYDHSQLVTDDGLVDTRREIFDVIEQMQIDVSATEKQLDLLEDIIKNVK